MSTKSPLLLGTWVLAALLALCACERRSRSGTSTPTDTTRKLVPKHTSWDADFTLTKGGRPRAILTAPRADQYEVSDSTYSVWRSTTSDTSRVHAYFFNQQGDSSATMTADSIVYQAGKGRLDAYGDAVVVTESSKRLESEHLTWRQADRRIRSRRFVRIITPEEVVQGNGLVAEEDLETYQIGRFEARVEVDDGEKKPQNNGG